MGGEVGHRPRHPRAGHGVSQQILIAYRDLDRPAAKSVALLRKPVRRPPDPPRRRGRGTPMSRYDLLVLGAGATGLAAARAARQAGRTVAIVDKAEPGGDCTHFGCVPSKTWLDVAHRVAGARHAQEWGSTPSGASTSRRFCGTCTTSSTRSRPTSRPRSWLARASTWSAAGRAWRRRTRSTSTGARCAALGWCSPPEPAPASCRSTGSTRCPTWTTGRVGPVEHPDLMHLLLEGPAELPLVVVREVGVRRDEDGCCALLGGDEELLDVPDRAVLLDALADQLPRWRLQG